MTALSTHKLSTHGDLWISRERVSAASAGPDDFKTM